MAAISISEAFELAVQHHQAGNHGVAEEIYRKILALVPDDADVLLHLGILASQHGRLDEACALIERALAGAPGCASGHCNHGAVLTQLGRHEEALAALRRALDLQPDMPEALNNQGNTYFALRRWQDAAAAYRGALRLQPGLVQAQVRLADVLVENGEPDGLAEAYDLASAVARQHPCLAEPFNTLGNIHLKRHQLPEALAAFTQAASLQPNLTEVHFNRASVLQHLGALADAEAAYRIVVAQRPGFFAAQNNLGMLLATLGRHDEALVHLAAAERIDPQHPAVHNNFGCVWKDLGEHDAALQAHRRSLELDPANPEAHSNLLLGMHYPDHVPAEVAAEHREWHRRHAQPVEFMMPAHANQRVAERRLRVGYFSPDLREHPVARLLVPILENHDPAKVEVFLYAQVVGRDALTERVRAAAPHWRELNHLDDSEAAGLIQSDQIDILVDLAGHTAGNRLGVFAHKPAPVQATYLGYPDSTGMEAIDYRLTDSLADPPGMTEALHAEELVRLDPCAWCMMPLPDVPVPPRQPGPLTIGSFHSAAKTTDAMLRLWARILQQLPDARLLVKGIGWNSQTARRRTSEVMHAAGIDPERVELHGQLGSYAEHLAMFGRLDLAMDTFPYHGTNMTFEALWMGVPFITMAGESHVARVGVSLLTNLGRPEWVCQSPDEYVAKAVAIAQDSALRSALRTSLRDELRRSPLMDGRGMAGRLEAAYQSMWRRWCGA